MSVSEALGFKVGADTSPFDRAMADITSAGKSAGKAVEKAFDDASDAIDGATKATQKTTKEVKTGAARITGDLHKAEGAADDTADAIDDIGGAAKAVRDTAHDAFGKIGRDMDMTTKKAQLSGASFGRIAGVFTSRAVLAGGLAVAGGITAAGAAAVSTGAEFERLSVRLGTLMGNAEVGKQRMEELFTIASTTPFDLGSVVEADVNLRALGVDAEKALPMVLDFAGAMGTDLTSASVEVGRAMQFGAGAVESIAGRALRAQVELRTGQDALKMSTQQFREELITTLTDPNGIFAGGTAKLSATFSGMVSNLEDEMTRFRKAVADSGLFEGVKAGARELLMLIEENRGAIGDLASEIGIGLIASLQLTIKGAGMVVDLFTSAKAAAIGLKLVALEVGAAIAGFVESQAGQLAQMADFLGVLNPAAAAAAVGLHALEGAAAGVAEAAETAANATAREFYDVAQQIGAGADAAERLNKAIDAGRSKGGSTAAVAGVTRPPSTGAAAVATGGQDAGKAAADALAMEEHRLRLIAEEDALIDGITKHRLSAAEQIDRAEMDSLAQLQRIAEERILLAENDSAQKLEIIREFEADKALIEDEYRQRRMELDDMEARARMDKAIAGVQQAFGLVVSTVGSAAQVAYNSASKAADAYAESGSAAAKAHADETAKSYKRIAIGAKSLAMLQTGLNTAAAVTMTLSVYPFPLNIAMAALTAIAGAAQIAVAASTPIPSFNDTPGAIQAGAAGLRADFAPGDYVIAAQTPAAAQRQAEALTGGGNGTTATPQAMPTIIVEQSYQHHIVGRVMLDESRRGSALTRQLQRGRMIGALGH